MSNVLFVDGPAGEARDRPTDGEALDAYSSVITTVARDLAPSVANLRVIRRVRGGRRGAGGGSAFVLAPDGYLSGHRGWRAAAAAAGGGCGCRC